VVDCSILPRPVLPVYADWYLQFGRNWIGLLYRDRSAGAAQLDPQRWWVTQLTPGVRTGVSDPARDPAGYRTLLVFTLAGRHCGVPGLAAQLRAAIPPGEICSRASELVDAVRRSALDYVFEHASVANARASPSCRCLWRSTLATRLAGNSTQWPRRRWVRAPPPRATMASRSWTG
jgi:molybdate/tungstate transport system substrate-binding protein